MSLIVTQVSPLGILHATDSILSDENGRFAGKAAKLYSIKRHCAALTACGSFSTGGVRIDGWLNDFIAKDSTGSLRQFVTDLTKAIRSSPFTGVIIHIAGYQQVSGAWQPQFFHISDVNCDPGTGHYTRKKGGFEPSDDELSRRHDQLPVWFANGFPAGRQAYVELLHRISRFREEAYQTPGWPFKRSAYLGAEAKYLRLDMMQIRLMFLNTILKGPVIGGKIQLLSIRKPSKPAAQAS